MKVAISTDTNSGITCAEARETGLHVLPMPVIIDGQTYLEGMDVDHARLYDTMRQHKAVSTSQPSPGQLMELWDGILAEGFDEIVHIPMSSGLSGSCENAIQLAASYGGRVQVADNHRISVTQRESAYSALQLVRQGANAREVYAKSRGAAMAEKKMLEAIRKDRETRFAEVSDAQLQIDVAGTLESDEGMQRWLRMARAEFFGARIEYVHLPCSIACHVGVNAAGIAITRLTGR